ncbi:hypothetical protein ACFLZB_01665 [Nanoarchaeota archaeon]
MNKKGDAWILNIGWLKLLIFAIFLAILIFVVFFVVLPKFTG